LTAPDGFTSRPAYGPLTPLGIRVHCANGAVYEDPVAGRLADLLRARRSGDPYLILERLDGTPGILFIQAYANGDESWLVEYRDSDADPLFRAQTRDVEVVYAVLVEWSLRAPGWRNRLAWAPFDLVSRSATPALKDDGTLVLRHSKDERGTRHLSAHRGADGSLHIDGHDLGSGVADAFGSGNTEYEWCWTVRPDDVPAVVAALGGDPGDDVLAVLARWSAANDGRDPGQGIRDAGVPVVFDNRVGD
ncbi:MAG TPA: hypothetical protein VLH81_14390, partial [Desulfobacterales bacterium]|nr:hypothetical protein [Desulfobacterales bacterium]